MIKNVYHVLVISVFVLLVSSCIAYAIPVSSTGDWNNNLLKEDHGAVPPMEESGEESSSVITAFGVSEWRREDIQGVYVLDSLQDMPFDAIDISEDGNGSVMGWLDENKNLYIAGEGGVKAPQDMSALFGWYQNAKEIDLGGNLHTEDSTDFRFMFYHCYNAEKINLEGLDTSKATTFSKMFAYCSELSELDVSMFTTTASESFYQMFIGCESLEKLDLTTFSPVNARTVALMFYKCADLEEIRFSEELFDTSNVKRMSSMFLGCRNLRVLDISWFNMQSAESVRNMFTGCTSLPFIDLSSWDMPNVKNHRGMFENSSLEYNYGANGEYFFGYERN